MASDDRLFQRVTLTAVVVTAIALVPLAAYLSWVAALNFALGAALGIASLGTLAWLVDRVTRPGSRPGKSQLALAALLHIGKYAVIAVGLYLLLRTGGMHPAALAAGFTLPTAVLCLKSAGRALNAHLGVRVPPSAAPAHADPADRIGPTPRQDSG